MALILSFAIGSTITIGMTTYGYYNIENTLTHGIRAWAFSGSGYSSASAKIVEGNYDSGWEKGRDVEITKIKNPIYKLYRYHKFNK